MDSHLAQTLIESRWLILVPLSFAEGPVIAFVAGTLAAAGYFNIFVLAAFFFGRDMFMDGLYYLLGYYGGRTRLAHRLLAKIGVEEAHLEHVRGLWTRRAGITMLLGKISYGISTSFIVVAGMIHMPLQKFFGWGAVAAVVQYGVLLVLGYFLGGALGGTIERLISNFEYVLLGLSVFLVGYFFVSIKLSKRMLKEVKDDTPPPTQ